MVNKIIQCIPFIHPSRGIFICGLISAGLYGGALLFQHVGGLVPCNLCLWQRWPHIIIIVLVTLTPIVKFHRVILSAILMTATVSLMLAIYHSGVEWKLWGGVKDCAVSLGNLFDLKNQTDALLSTPIARCDEVAWSFLGLSMAGWNAIFSLDLCLIALICLVQEKKEKK